MQQNAIERRLKTVLYLGLGRVVQIGYHWNSRMHKHNAIAFIFSKTPFRLRLREGEWQSARAVIINSNIDHEIIYPDQALVSCRIIPLRKRGQQLQDYVLRGEPLRELDYGLVAHFINQLGDCSSGNCHNAKVFRTCEQLFDALTGSKCNDSIIDNRIIEVMNYIQKNIDVHISAKKLAESVFISEDRFLHLFKEQVGIPLRQYIIYQRTIFASDAFLNGEPICRAAQLAGFSDCAHFTRTFVELNGLKPSDIVKYRENIQTLICSSTSCIRPAVADENHNCRDCRFFVS